MESWTREELPARFHLGSNARVGDLITEAPTGTWLAEHSGVAGFIEGLGRRGAHAYDSDRPEMHTWLVVLGSGTGDLGEVPLWDLAPTIAAWMEIKWAVEPDGKPVDSLR